MSSELTKDVSVKFRKLMESRSFWVSVGILSASSMIFYSWYRDRYATPLERYERIKVDWEMNLLTMHKLRKAFLQEMEIGLEEPDDVEEKKKQSSLKMLHSNVVKIPTGTEKGVFYTLDWGGSNYRILKIEFKGKNEKVVSHETRIRISEEFQKTNNKDKLFRHLVQVFKEHVEKYDPERIKSQTAVPVGFTFSFPMIQPRLDAGILLEWTKGFDIPDVVGKNITELMHQEFKHQQLPAKIEAVVNDTVGTLLACAYEHENVRIGLIIGTGTNAAYVEPSLNGEIINIEWGNFNKHLPRTPVDCIMDEYTPNQGVYLNEKLISGYYIGEMCRLLAIELFREQITDLGNTSVLNERWKFTSELVSEILQFQTNYRALTNFIKNTFNFIVTVEEAEVFQKACRLVVNRSADMAAVCLTAVFQKTGIFITTRKDERNANELDKFIFCEEYIRNPNRKITVGVDGSVYKKTPNYARRMQETISLIVTPEVGRRVTLVHSEDGSGKGAALAVAAKLSVI